ncbi:MAG TPA: hypothetical protein VJ160_05915 [Anaerolineales bacterium]|nr:hypothetical protein [Anaerolineales bacterium]
MSKPTPVDHLRRPHPEQERIDAESARLLRQTVQQRLDRIYHRPALAPGASPVGKTTRP